MTTLYFSRKRYAGGRSLATTVSAKGWVVIPKELRKKYGLTPGRKVTILDYGDSLAIVPVSDDALAKWDGRFAEPGGASWTGMLLEERRRDREREDRHLAR